MATGTLAAEVALGWSISKMPGESLISYATAKSEIAVPLLGALRCWQFV